MSRVNDSKCLLYLELTMNFEIFRKYFIPD